MLNQMEINLLLIETVTNAYNENGEMSTEILQFEIDQNHGEIINVLEVDMSEINKCQIHFTVNKKVKHLEFCIN